MDVVHASYKAYHLTVYSYTLNGKQGGGWRACYKRAELRIRGSILYFVVVWTLVLNPWVIGLKNARATSQTLAPRPVVVGTELYERICLQNLPGLLSAIASCRII